MKLQKSKVQNLSSENRNEGKFSLNGYAKAAFWIIIVD